MHDWTRVDAFAYYDFSIAWNVELRKVLNRGVLPNGYYATIEQLGRNSDSVELDAFADRSIVVRKASLNRVIGRIEILGPATKQTCRRLQECVRRIVQDISTARHVLVVDPFPTNLHAPNGIHGAVWNELNGDSSYTQPSDEPLTLVSYCSATDTAAYLEPFAVGQKLENMPLFLSTDTYVLVDLESTYQSAWDATADEIRQRLSN